jgi:hypothetical protein
LRPPHSGNSSSIISGLLWALGVAAFLMGRPPAPGAANDVGSLTLQVAATPAATIPATTRNADRVRLLDAKIEGAVA